MCGGTGETGGEKNLERAMASSARSLSSSAPVVVVVVVFVVVEGLIFWVCAAGTAILMPESPVQGDARKLSRGEEAPSTSCSSPSPGEDGGL